jgi:hypothetical protein
MAEEQDAPRLSVVTSQARHVGVPGPFRRLQHDDQ